MHILVLGYIVRGPLGGLAWHHLQYVLGLKQAGHQVLFLEDSDDYPSCYNPERFETTTDPAYGLRFIEAFFAKFDLQHNWAYFDAHSNRWFGQNRERVFSFCQKTDVLLNLSGMNPLRDWHQNIPCRVLIDTDPAFTQIKHLTSEIQMSLAKAHTHFFSFGENIGKENCTVPADGFNWLPTRQPVVMNAWPASPATSNAKWTTVMQWDSYNVREFEGKRFGMKSSSFEAYWQLPKCIADKIELALGSNAAPRKKLAAEGWHVTDPLSLSLTPQAYQNYIAGSKGEWSVAKEGYVSSNCGWFSERTLNYMASGKPVVVQDTGFSSFLPTGEGLLPFANLEEAVNGMENANADYKKHAKAAKEIVAGYFTAGSVLQALLSRL